MPNKVIPADLTPDPHPSLQTNPSPSSSEEDDPLNLNPKLKRSHKRMPKRSRKCAKAPNYRDWTSSPSNDSSSHRSSSETSSEENQGTATDSSDDSRSPSPTQETQANVSPRQRSPTPSEPQASDSDDSANTHSPLNGGKQQLKDAQATDCSLKGCLANAELKKGDFFFKKDCSSDTGPHPTGKKKNSRWCCPTATERPPCETKELQKPTEDEDDVPTWSPTTAPGETNISSDLSQERANEMARVMEKHNKIMSNVPGRTSLTSISIDTGDAVPIHTEFPMLESR